jgi:hypothetical protein
MPWCAPTGCPKTWRWLAYWAAICSACGAAQRDRSVADACAQQCVLRQRHAFAFLAEQVLRRDVHVVEADQRDRHAVPAQLGNHRRYRDAGRVARHDEGAQSAAAAGTVGLARHHHEHVGYVGARDELLLAIERPAALRCRRIVRPQPRHVAACAGLGQCEGRLACAAGQVGDQRAAQRLAAAGHDGARGQVGACDQRSGRRTHRRYFLDDAHAQHHRRLAAAVRARERGGDDAFAT